MNGKAKAVPDGSISVIAPPSCRSSLPIYSNTTWFSCTTRGIALVAP
jgi:hypothetical protein